MSATDASGNRGQCSVTVTVSAPPEADAGPPDGGMVADGGAMSDGGALPDGGSGEADAGMPADAGTDAGAVGTDGGADAGRPDTGGGSDAGPQDPVPESSGCGCGSTGGPGFGSGGWQGSHCSRLACGAQASPGAPDPGSWVSTSPYHSADRTSGDHRIEELPTHPLVPTAHPPVPTGHGKS